MNPPLILPTSHTQYKIETDGSSTRPFYLVPHALHPHYLNMLPERKTLPHNIPNWVADGSQYFITICCKTRGKNQLCHEEIFKFIQESLSFRQNRNELWVHLLILMPDHLHGIISFGPNTSMRNSISQWKRYVSTNSSVIWQRDFFDHRLRNDENYVEKAHYIRMNPVRAGLAESPEEWPFIYENVRTN